MEANNTLTTIRGKRRHLFDKRTGFGLCGAGEPNLQFPLGSGIRGQGQGLETVTCYKCLKLNYINDLEDIQAIPTRDFQPTDLTPLKTEVDPQSYKRRRKHIMIPFGIEGIFGGDIDFTEANIKKIKEKMYSNIKKDSNLTDPQKETLLARLSRFKDYLAELKMGRPQDITIWTKYSPFKVGNKSHRQKPSVKMRTQRPPVKGKLADINYSAMNVENREKESINERKRREKQVKLQLLNIGLRLMDMIKAGNVEDVRDVAKRKDKIGLLAKRILVSENEKQLRAILQKQLQYIANPTRMLEYNAMADFEEEHENQQAKSKVKKYRRKKIR